MKDYDYFIKKSWYESWASNDGVTCTLEVKKGVYYTLDIITYVYFFGKSNVYCKFRVLNYDEIRRILWSVINEIIDNYCIDEISECYFDLNVQQIINDILNLY